MDVDLACWVSSEVDVFDGEPFSCQSNDARAWSWKHNGKAADFPPKEKNHVFSKNFSATVKDCGIFSPIEYKKGLALLLCGTLELGLPSCTREYPPGCSAHD